jgi:two-component system NtrC family sensor kinase
MDLSAWGVAEDVTRASLDAVVIADSGGHVFEYKPPAESMFAYSRYHAMGRSIGGLILPNGETRWL